MSSDALGYYAILEVSSNSDEATIKQHYRDLAKIWHPDHSKQENAINVFQKISNAYDILKDEQKRLTYDLLCLIYNKNNFPDMFTLKILRSKKHASDINIKMLTQTSVKSWFLGYETKENKFVVTEKEALKKTLIISLENWLLGWWHPKGFIQNLKAIIDNFNTPIKKEDNLRLYIHNSLACFQEKKYKEASYFINLAMAYNDNKAKELLQKLQVFVGSTFHQIPKKWNISILKYIQLSFIFILFTIFAFSFSAKIVTEADLMNHFTKKKEVNYYQEVNFRGGRGVDDVIVGKVVNIPVDTSDDSKLYHITKDTTVMHGPSDSFDILTTISSRTTVRITGITPDELWFRIMLDNGEMGFVKREFVSSGIGKKIPESSKIISH